MDQDINQVLLSEKQLLERVRELGEQISADYLDKDFVVVCVLRGSFIFVSDLVRSINIPLAVDFISISSYGSGTTSSGVVRFLKDLDEVIFTSSDGDVKIWIGATNKFNAKSNSFSVMKYCNATKDFEIKIPIENFKKIPTGDYTLEIKYNSARDAYRILLKNKDLESFKLLLSVKV